MTGSEAARLVPAGLLAWLLAAPALAQTSNTPAPPLPKVDLRYGSASGPLASPHLEDVHVVYGGEATLDADAADADRQAGRYTLRGHVRAHETDTTLRAGEIAFGGPSRPSTATDSLLTRSVFTLRAPRIEGDVERLTAYGGSLTTVPDGGPADYYVRAQTVTLDSRTHRGVLRNATLFLFGARLLTVPRVTFHYGGRQNGARRQVMIPVFGVSARYGTYLAFGSGLHVGHLPLQYRLLLPTRQTVQASLDSEQTLYAPRGPVPPPAPPSPTSPTFLDRLRTLATIPPGPLPDGDPLRFRDFLPDPNPIRLFEDPSRGGLGLAEDVSVHVAARGRLRDDLYVSRLPEVTLRGELPLTAIPRAPAYGDPQAFRAALRHVVLYVNAQETFGEYREQPTNIQERRAQARIGLNSRPLLVAPDTVLLPFVSLSTSGYSGSKKAYRYTQAGVAVSHYFSDLSALGVQFLVSSTSGDSPFNFDVLDTSRELDVRLQLGNRHLVGAGRVRYDLSRGGVIDYQLALAPGLRGFLPVFSYNFRTRSVGLGIEVQGITF